MQAMCCCTCVLEFYDERNKIELKNKCNSHLFFFFIVKNRFTIDKTKLK